jgi:hypothetical protein
VLNNPKDVNSVADAVRAVDVSSTPPGDADASTWSILEYPIEPHVILTPDDLSPRYLNGPITPHLLRLVPGDPESITAFVANLGWRDLATWAWLVTEDRTESRDLWEGTLIVPVETAERAQQWLEAIVAAWVDPGTKTRFHKAQRDLLFSWREAARDDWSPSERLDWMSGYFRHPAAFSLQSGRPYTEPQALRLGMGVRGDPPRLVFVPADIFARSYVELAQLLGRRQLKPVQCAHCDQWFPPNRDGQRFCPGSSCKTDHDAAYSKHPYRKEYQRMYQRHRRGTMSRSEWDEWRDRNPGPDAWEGANPDGLDSED